MSPDDADHGTTDGTTDETADGTAGGPAGTPTVPPPGPEALAEFGEHVDTAVRYVERLAGAGVERGLLGPREAPRLWERHLLNCVRLERLIPEGQSVLDVGSGAGLPGLVLAVRRPDLSIVLLEPLLRRSEFLQETVDLLGLSGVTVVRGRAEEQEAGRFDVVTSRAVAPLAKLAGWCLPLVRPGGRMLALKGSSAAEELAASTTGIARAGGTGGVVHTLHGAEGSPPTVVVEIGRAEHRRRPQKRRA